MDISTSDRHRGSLYREVGYIYNNTFSFPIHVINLKKKEKKRDHHRVCLPFGTTLRVSVYPLEPPLSTLWNHPRSVCLPFGTTLFPDVGGPVQRLFSSVVSQSQVWFTLPKGAAAL
jgi:hypothetical protein